MFDTEVLFGSVFAGIIVWNCCSQDESMGHSEGPTNQQPTMAAVLKLDKVIQTVVATLVNIEELKPEQEKCGYKI